MADGEWQTVATSRHHQTSSNQHSTRGSARGGAGGGARRSYPPATPNPQAKHDLDQNWRRSDSRPQGAWKQGRPQHRPPHQQQQQQHSQRSALQQPRSPPTSSIFPIPPTSPTFALPPTIAVFKPTTAEFSPQTREESTLFDASDNDSGGDESDDTPAPIDIPLPPYHTTIVVLCPFDDCPAVAPFTDTTALVKHLKEQHHVMFCDIHHMYIALDRYISHWAKEVQTKGLEAIGVKDNEDVYIIDPKMSAEDKELRDTLQREKLNEILKIQERERHKDSKQPRKCLFCKNMCENRTALFKHMFSEHNFNIGLPDNLVNVNEFLDMLEGKLTNLQCLYCEKIFTTPAVLRKHMRKKKHFKIAAKNRLYDPFYVINYLEPGKNWENFESERYESDEDRRDDSWADWDEDEPEPTMCLFDDVVLASAMEALDHMRDIHAFDLSKVKAERGLDFYKTVILINYIRYQTSQNTCYSCGASFGELAHMTAHMQQAGCLTKVPGAEAEFWKDQKYLLPTYDNDPLLTGFDDDDDDDDNGMPVDQEARRRLIAQQKEELQAAALLAGDNIVGGIEAALAREVEAVKLEEGFGGEADGEDEK
ncbi:hypothetical protein BC937DRAFT_91438 [Endogone sp. FLAS-F59071]|nr:hypothetical protein BC937DRAFT_91438 [Endogone sp. FLAS-F59071]|eukprot:RUS21796.1 hypothetical protein BC937DRAFT_91438 [Endogone sp. FLAS-F59071]